MGTPPNTRGSHLRAEFLSGIAGLPDLGPEQDEQDTVHHIERDRTLSGRIKVRLWLLAVLALALPRAAPAQSITAWQERIFAALVRQDVVSPRTRLVSLKPVCTLSVGGKIWQVVDVVEHVPGTQVPRGRNRIVMLDRALRLVRSLDYTDQYPMACSDSRLFVHGDYGIDNSPPYGNVLNFWPDGEVVVTRIEANDLPIPLTAQRRTFRLP